MTIKVGDRLPEATFMTMTKDGPQPVTTDAIFKGVKAILFAVPGAFTPTCSAKHLPGFKEHVDEFRAKGVDKLVCLSVNDVFVMGAWAKDQGVGEDVLLVADGNGEFTKKVGLELDGARFGMGLRSQRYAMLVNDMVVEQLFVEAGGEFRVSSADYMLEHI